MVRAKQGNKAAAAPAEETKVDSTTPSAEEEEPAAAAPATNGDANADNESGEADSTAEEKVETPAEEKKKKAASKKKGGKKAATPAENGETAPAPAPKKKKVVPAWASLSDAAKSKATKSADVKASRPKMDEQVLDAINTCADSKGCASAVAIRNFLLSENPDMPKGFIKKSVMRALNKNLIKQVKGTGFSGSFKVETGKKAAGKKGKSAPAATGSMEDVFPLVFTWACNPKEASVHQIRKYITENYPELKTDGDAFKKALEAGERKGQLDRITGKGNSGTFALMDGADKSGAKYEDAFESAIIAMNEPKDCSVPTLRDYLGVYHKEFDTDNRPLKLKKALERAEDKGFIQRITGKGFSGTFRLAWPFYPSPRVLWGDEFKEPKKEKNEREKPSSSRKRVVYSEDSESEEEEESEAESDFEEEVLPKSTKRGAPKSRAAPPAKKPKAAAAKKPAAKKSAAVVAKKSKPVVAKKSKPGKGKKGRK